MKNDFIANILESYSNGFIILNLQKEVIYANKVIKKVFSSEFNRMIGDYLRCNNTIEEGIRCQNTSKCGGCILNKSLDEVIDKKNIKFIKDLEFNSNGETTRITCKISYMNDCIVLEFYDFINHQDNLFFINKLLDNSNDLMFYKDANLKYVYINNSYKNFLGKKEKEEIVGKTDENLIPKELLEQCIESDIKTLETGNYSGVEQAGEKFYRVIKERVNGGILCIAKNITEEVIAYKESTIDVLTGLYNRRNFEGTIQNIYKERETGYYLIAIDLDDFRNINNVYGHPVGDEYLRKFGEILNTFRECGFFRVGGDEFAGLIKRSRNKVEQIVKEIFDHLELLNLNPKLTISVGIKEIDLSKDFTENYRLADKALYRAKETGKNKYYFYDVID